MKRHVQLPGVRKWSGNDLIELQSEGLSVLDSFLSQNGNCIISGCEVEENSISSGLVSIAGIVMPFEGATEVEFPVYLIKKNLAVQRAYADGVARDISVQYYADIALEEPEVEHILISADGSKRFLSQDSTGGTVGRMIADSGVFINAGAGWNSYALLVPFVDTDVAYFVSRGDVRNGNGLGFQHTMGNDENGSPISAPIPFNWIGVLESEAALAQKIARLAGIENWETYTTLIKLFSGDNTAVIVENMNAYSAVLGSSRAITAYLCTILNLNYLDFFAMNSIANSDIAMTALLSDDNAIATIAGSAIAMNSIANSDIAMTALLSNDNAIATIAASEIAMNSITENEKAILFALSNPQLLSIIIENFLLDLAVLRVVITIPSAVAAIAENSEGLSKILANPAALEVLIANQEALNIVLTSENAMNLVANSAPAMLIIANSTEVLRAITDSVIAMTAIEGSNLAKEALYSSSLIENFSTSISTTLTKRRNGRIWLVSLRQSASSTATTITHETFLTGNASAEISSSTCYNQEGRIDRFMNGLSNKNSLVQYSGYNYKIIPLE